MRSTSRWWSVEILVPCRRQGQGWAHDRISGRPGRSWMQIVGNAPMPLQDMVQSICKQSDPPDGALAKSHRGCCRAQASESRHGHAGGTTPETGNLQKRNQLPQAIRSIHDDWARLFALVAVGLMPNGERSQVADGSRVETVVDTAPCASRQVILNRCAPTFLVRLGVIFAGTGAIGGATCWITLRMTRRTT